MAAGILRALTGGRAAGLLHPCVRDGNHRGDVLMRPHPELIRMTCLHAPLVPFSTYWEKSIKDNYTTSMSCHLVSLTDNGCRKVDNTVVYIPKEGLQRSPEEASKDKTPVQRMESKPKGLCECMSNEIIRLCFQSISLDKIFKCYEISSKQNLSDCIQCWLSWKEIYLHASQNHHKYHISEPVTHTANITVSPHTGFSHRAGRESRREAG
ncbi:uncharacterized protein LOC113747626 [Larimichthys crocea]|uniref:uncharacterized protein LOC113747626 n=1 Tax=Larimichthys crocea TaxID=215358 RepID=UPI000F5EAC7A|nr:uncharacterized protein LOC113747626 [Larimichthys crocea]